MDNNGKTIGVFCNNNEKLLLQNIKEVVLKSLEVGL